MIKHISFKIGVITFLRLGLRVVGAFAAGVAGAGGANTKRDHGETLTGGESEGDPSPR
jgi:hypothetical protein